MPLTLRSGGSSKATGVMRTAEINRRQRSVPPGSGQAVAPGSVRLPPGAHRNRPVEVGSTPHGRAAGLSQSAGASRRPPCQHEAKRGDCRMADELEERWDTTDERERRIRSIPGARRGRRMHARQSQATSLREGLETQRFISSLELRELVDRTYDQPVVSVYLNLTPEHVVRRPPVYLSMFNSMRHREVASRGGLIATLPRRQRYALQGDLDVVEELLGMLHPTGTRSIVVFKSGRELNRVIMLPVRAADSLTIDADPYVEPLEAILEAHPRCLVVEVAKEESRFWVHHLGQLAQVEAVHSFMPTDTVDASRPGKVQRHRLQHLRWHLKTSVHVAARLCGERDLGLMVLAGEERVLAHMEIGRAHV